MSTRAKGKQGDLPAVASTTPLPTNLINFLERKFKEQQAVFELKLKESENRIVERFSEIEANILNLRKEVKNSNSKCIKVEKRCDALEYEVQNLMRAISSTENNVVAADVVLLNIPNEINCSDAFNKIVSVLPGEQIKAIKIFRTHKTNNNAKAVPIIVKLHSADERVKLFRALAEYKKKIKRNYKLSDFGLIGDVNVIVHECLSSLHRDILRHALHFKRSKLLHSVFTLRGFVFARKQPADNAIKIRSIDDLNKLIGALDNNISNV